jgi:hypothetical protein
VVVRRLRLLRGKVSWGCCWLSGRKGVLRHAFDSESFIPCLGWTVSWFADREMCTNREIVHTRQAVPAGRRVCECFKWFQGSKLSRAAPAAVE